MSMSMTMSMTMTTTMIVTMTMNKSLFFYSFPQARNGKYISDANQNFDDKTFESLFDYFQSQYDLEEHLCTSALQVALVA